MSRIIAAGIAAGLVSLAVEGLVFIVVMTMGQPATGIVGLVLAVIVVFLAPFAAGVAGGYRSGRAVALVGSVVGFLVPVFAYFAIAGLDSRDMPLYAPLALVGVLLAVSVVVGHFIGIPFRRTEKIV